MLKKCMVIGIIFILSFSFGSNISGYNKETSKELNNKENFYETQENVIVSCNTYGIYGEHSKQINLLKSEAEELLYKINELADKIAYYSNSVEIEQLQQEIITIGKEYDLVTEETSLEDFQPKFTSLLNPKNEFPPINRNKGTAALCNFLTVGEGSQIPVIVLPRLIPIIQMPIPRVFLRWSSPDGMTSCGSYLTNTGFIASGEQTGLALGFWGIGFSIFLPPIQAYGFFGYALYSKCTAENMEPWPPNNPPIISDESPTNGEWDISVSTNELSFKIDDPDGDKLDYTVTTEPDIGSGSGTNKNSGTYTIPISNLEHTKSYKWTVEVTDKEDTVSSELSFMTEELPFDPFEEGWQYKKKITIDHAKVDGDLKMFPVLISTVDSDLKDKAQNDGDDILFMDDLGVANQIHHEIEQYEGNSGKLIAWVNVEDLSASQDTEFYMYYGNPSCDNQQYPGRVWNSNYKAVYHMNCDSGQLIDSTSNEIICDKIRGSPNYQQSGKIGYGIDFERDNNEAFEDGDVFDGLKEMTVEAWVNLESYHSSHSTISSKTGAWYFRIHSELDAISYGTHGGAHNSCVFDDIKCPLDSWYYVVGTWSDFEDRMQLFGNGVLKDTYYETLSMKTSTNNFAIGNSGSSNYFDGLIDELRISDVERSDSWIKTTYNNQNNPEEFLIVGPEETN